MDRDGGVATREHFYKKYSAALIAAALTAALGFIALAVNPAYTSAGERIGNATGAGLLFGSMAFAVGWLLTIVKRQITSWASKPTITREPMPQPPPGPRPHPAAAPAPRPVVNLVRPPVNGTPYDIHLDQLEPTVRRAAQQYWPVGNYEAAVTSAAKAVNSLLQNQVKTWHLGENQLIHKAFSLDPPKAGDNRLRFRGDRRRPSWKSRMNGARSLGEACFAGVRNIGAHEEDPGWTRQHAFEYLVLFSVFARWLQECDVEWPPA